MKTRLLTWLRCPACGGRLSLVAGAERNGEVLSGTLRCASDHRFDIIDGVPRLHVVADAERDGTQVRTAESFGYLWAQPAAARDVYGAAGLHHALMEQRLSLPAPCGLVLDAGCGDGLDLAAQARRPGVEAIGVELSDGGSRTSFARAAAHANAHVVQADLRRLPFASETFDAVYSYGVLHHLEAPTAGVEELVRVAKPDAAIAAYVYEDFADRSLAWRVIFKTANALRYVSTRLPHTVLYRCCQVAAPVVFLTFTIPARAARSVPGLSGIADRVPFRHGTGLFGLVGDLFDRLSAPIERRYDRAGATGLFREAGLDDVRVMQERGWMIAGRKRISRAAAR